MKHTDGLKLFKDLSEHCIRFTDLLDEFRELPRADQDRLLATILRSGFFVICGLQLGRSPKTISDTQSDGALFPNMTLSCSTDASDDPFSLPEQTA